MGPRGRRGAGTRRSVPSSRPRPGGQPLSSGGGSGPGDPSPEALDRNPRPSGIGFCCVVPGDGQRKESRPQGLPRVPVRLQPQPLGPLWVTPPHPSRLGAERLASSLRGSPFSGVGGASRQGLPSRTARPPIPVTLDVPHRQSRAARRVPRPRDTGTQGARVGGFDRGS